MLHFLDDAAISHKAILSGSAESLRSLFSTAFLVFLGSSHFAYTESTRILNSLCALGINFIAMAIAANAPGRPR